jgi:hypothetical protein
MQVVRAPDSYFYLRRRYPSEEPTIARTLTSLSRTMRNAALARNDEYEVPVSSTEVLEATIAAIRESLNEFKLEVRAAFSNINSEMRFLRERNDTLVVTIGKAFKLF